MSTHARLAAVADKDEIRELTARYCFAVAEGDADTIVGLFTDNGIFETRGTVVAGRAALQEFYDELAGGVTPKPFIQNHVIDVDGDSAQGRCGVEIRMVRKGEAYTVAGHYHDTYWRVDGAWKFAKRDFQTYHFVKLKDGWAE